MQDWLAAIVESSDDAIISNNLNAVIISWNISAERIFGYTAEEAIGQPSSIVLPHGQPDEIPALLDRFKHGERIQHFETKRRRKDGATLDISLTISPIRDADGNIVGVSQIARVISEQQHAEETQRFLSEVSMTLAASLSYEATLSSVARLAVSFLADWCVVDMLEPDGLFHRLAAAAADPAKVELVRTLQQRYPIVKPETRHTLVNVFGANRSWIDPDVSPERLAAEARDADHLKLEQTLGFKSEMVIPLVARERILGTITLVSARRSYNQSDLALAEDLARRAAIYIDNARLYRQADQERARWQVTLSSIGDAVIATDMSGRITFINPVAEALTGWPESEAISQPASDVFQIVNEYTRQPVNNPVEKVLLEGMITGLANHTILLRKDDVEVPIDDSGAPIRDEAGNMIGVILVFRDITERKQTEADQSRLHQRLIQASDRTQRLQEVTAALAQSLVLSHVGTAFVELAVSAVGAAAGSMVRLVHDHTLEIVETNHYRGDVVQSWQQFSLDSPVPLAETVRTARPVYIDSPDMWLARYSSPPVLPQFGAWAALPLMVDGKPIGGISFSFPLPRPFPEEDKKFMETLTVQCAQAFERALLYMEVQAHAEILELRVAERTAQLEEALKLAQAADLAKTIMLSNVTHEMRTPLSSIIGFSNLILQRRLSEEKSREFTRVISLEAQRMATLVDNFLNLQHILSGRQLFQFAPLELATLIQDILNTYPLEEPGKHQVELHLAPVPPVSADIDQMRRVILNLLSNAIKYSPGGGVIHLTLESTENEVVFSITDPGIGIPHDELEQLFVRFQRGIQAEQLRIQGTGLGLALCKEIVDAHNGRIWAESAGLDQGAAFKFALPVSSKTVIALASILNGQVYSIQDLYRSFQVR